MSGTSFEQSELRAHVLVAGGAVVVVVVVVAGDASTHAEPDASKPERHPARTSREGVSVWLDGGIGRRPARERRVRLEEGTREERDARYEHLPPSQYRFELAGTELLQSELTAHVGVEGALVVVVVLVLVVVVVVVFLVVVVVLFLVVVEDEGETQDEPVSAKPDRQPAGRKACISTRIVEKERRR
mgnify:CR=1 FL=1